MATRVTGTTRDGTDPVTRSRRRRDERGRPDRSTRDRSGRAVVADRRCTRPADQSTPRRPSVVGSDGPAERAAATRLAPAPAAVAQAGRSNAAAIGNRSLRAGHPGAQRLPFIILLVGLLAGALASVLVINTTLAAGAFRITRLQQADQRLAKLQQQLQQQVAAAQAPSAIASRAAGLGMRTPNTIHYLDVRTGRVITVPAAGPAAAGNPAGGTP